MTDVELAVQDPAGIRAAADLGVTRIELCSALAMGGLTPSAGLISAASARVPTHVLVRPRAGHFTYTPEEIDLILADIHAAVGAGAHGVVVGALSPSGMPDLAALEKFILAAEGVEVTFHRAIDVAADLHIAAESLRGTGVKRILTSGGAPSAYEGREALAELVEICGGEIQVQAGAGINPSNVKQIVATGVAGVHFSAKQVVSTDPTNGVDFGGYETVDGELAAATVAALRA